MMSSKKSNNISEEAFLKNKARRKSVSVKSSQKKKKNKKKSQSPVLKGFLIALGVLAGIIILAVIVAAIYYFAVISTGAPDEHNENNDIFINSEGNEVNRVTATDGSKKYFTFLATATDRGGSLTDVIMVARFHYDDKNPEVSVLQIPRDTYVRICGNKLLFTGDGYLSSDNFYGESANLSIKINEAFYRGCGLAEETIDKMLAEVSGKNDSEIEKILKKKEYLFIQPDVKKVKNYAKETNSAEKDKIYRNIIKDFGITYLQSLIYYNYGIPTDYSAQVNINGFRGVVNAIGGVDLNVPTRMYYVDKYQDLYIDLYPGQQHLNGDKAEQFVRFRGYPGGDVARLDAQKLFINAFLDKVLSFSTVTKIDDIITEIQKNLYTDISFNNLLKFANKLLNMDIKNGVHMYTLPGTGEYIGPVSYFVANKAETIKLVNDEFNVFDSPLINEDFKMLDAEEIYRPAAVVTSTPAKSDKNSSKKNDENSKTTDTEASTDNKTEDGKTGETADENTKTDNFEGESIEDTGSANETPKFENTENTVNDSPIRDNSEVDNIGNTTGPESSTDAAIPAEDSASADAGIQAPVASSNSGEATTAPSESSNETATEAVEEPIASETVDENYQLLLDMAA